MEETTVTRNTERTRRAILDATASLLVQRGAGVTLNDVAREAGISKGGLLHHFPSRDALFLEVLRDTQEKLRSNVNANLDLSENSPGKLLRAYVRTLCGGDSELNDLLGGLSFWTDMEGVAGVEALDLADREWWNEQLVADGLDPVLVRIVRRSAEGLAGARTYGDETAEDVRVAGEELIRMTFARTSRVAQ